MKILLWEKAAFESVLVFIADICALFKECNLFLKQDYLSGGTCLNTSLTNKL